MALQRQGEQIKPRTPQLYWEIIHEYESNHGEIFGTPKLVLRQIIKYLNISSTEDLKALKTLDIGCGSETRKEYSLQNIGYHPTVCRFFTKLGIPITGIDINYPRKDKQGNPQTEEWKFIQMDLRIPNSLNILEDNSFNVVATTNLIPHGNIASTSPLLCNSNPYSNEIVKIEDEIFNQALRMLKPGGIFIVNIMTIYRKVQIGNQPYFKFTKVSTEGQDDLPYIIHQPILEALQTQDPPLAQHSQTLLPHPI